MARQLLLGRAERSTPEARRVAPEGAKGLTRAELQSCGGHYATNVIC
jgi:hypothetical protein